MPAYLVRTVLALLKVPWRKRNSLLYGTSDFLPDVLPAFMARATGREKSWVNCVFHLIPDPRSRQGSRVRNTVSFLMQRLSLFLIRSRADLVIVDNSTLKRELVEMGFLPDRVFVTAMGVDRPEPAEEPQHRNDGCFVGRLHPSKGVFDLVDIWRKVCERRPGSRLVVAGADPLGHSEELKKRIAQSSLDREMQVLGYLPGDELENELSSSRVFVLPSYEEGFGISILEAMSHGVPAVAYELPHYREVFGDALVTVDTGDVDAFAEEVLSLLDDEERNLEVSKKGQRAASRYSWKETSKREAQAIQNIPGWQD